MPKIVDHGRIGACIGDRHVERLDARDRGQVAFHPLRRIDDGDYLARTAER
ncbi:MULTISPECIES: hypothetical protein [Burkholderia]|uniref:hypothetical protein n=1 Tax=Burkholderia TaxID=32008 RepID=UPI00157A3172|nr:MULTISPECIES: hypothetical protein [Burkholderia]MCU9951911.1 hypothetical protein [Burkholderia sp. BKH01]